MMYRVCFALVTFIAVITVVAMSVSCSVDGTYIVSPRSLSDDLPEVEVGDCRQDIEEELGDADVAFTSPTQLSYYLNGVCNLIAFALENDEVISIVAFVEADMVTWEEVVSQFESYRMVESDGNEMSAYISNDNTKYGEVRSIVKDGIRFYSIGWSLIR